MAANVDRIDLGGAVDLSVVIAVYQSEDCLGELHKELIKALQQTRLRFEVIYVEDHGGDGSWSLITEFASCDPRVKGVKFCRNFGQHYALSAGLDIAEGEHVVLMDCDLQDHPREIARLYSKAMEGFDVVLVRRLDRTTRRVDRLLGTVYYKLFDILTGTRTDPSVGTFRILSRKVVLSFRQLNERHRFLGGMIQWMGFRTAHVDIEQTKRFAGRSSYTFGRRLSLAVDGVLSFSNKPLILLAKFGVLQIIVSSMIAAWIVYLRITGRIAEVGFASIMVSLFFLGGIIMLSLGVLGVYIGRIYDQVKGRPYYIIEQVTFNE